MPTPFTFEETNGGTGGSTTVQGSGGATSSASSASSGAGGALPMCDVGFECVDDVPAGWDGPGQVYVSPAGGPMHVCTNGEKAARMFAKPSIEPHACEACTGCSNPTATCSAPSIQCWFGSSQCGGATGVQMQLMTSSCATDATSPVAEDQLGSCKLIGGPVEANPGTCLAGSSGVIPPEDHEEDVFACDVVKGGTCTDDTYACVQIPSDGARLCIGTVGFVDQCPAGWPDKIEAFDKLSDERTCSACGCEPLKCSGGQYTVGDAATCDFAGAATVVVNSTNCTPVDNILDGAAASFKPVLGKPEGVGCNGGEPEGSVVATDPVSLCCKPLNTP